jgi:hypothetical protein
LFLDKNHCWSINFFYNSLHKNIEKGRKEGGKKRDQEGRREKKTHCLKDTQNSSYSEAEIGRIMVQGQPRQKLVRSYLNKQAECGGACL